MVYSSEPLASLPWRVATEYVTVYNREPLMAVRVEQMGAKRWKKLPEALRHSVVLAAAEVKGGAGRGGGGEGRGIVGASEGGSVASSPQKECHRVS
jgi:hypothetical protein